MATANSWMTATMKNIILTLLAATAFNNAGWKVDADGKIETKDGNPIWVEADGTERTLGADAINRANNDAKNARIKMEAAENKLKTFEGIDPVKAKEAIDKLATIDQGKLIDNGKVEEVRQEVMQQFQTQIAEKDKAYAELQTRYDNGLVSHMFSGSDFIRDNVAMPRDFFEANFRGNFKVEDGKIAAYDKAGNRIMSKSKIGEYAEGDEALTLLVDAHPQKDMILKASGNSGTGNGGNGGNRPGGRTIKRADFDALSPAQRLETAKKAGAGEISIVD